MTVDINTGANFVATLSSSPILPLLIRERFSEILIGISVYNQSLCFSWNYLQDFDHRKEQLNHFAVIVDM